MGRTGRIRGRRKVSNPNISNDSTFINLVKWLRKNEWTPTCRLQPVLYQDFGRGLMAKDSIRKGDVLFSLPYSVLITNDNVEESPVACVFHCMKTLKAQDVFSLFLIWEKQRGLQSEWYNYIMSLPTDFTLPLFCSTDELILMPFIFKAVENQKKKIMNSWKCISSVIKTLHCCEFCGKKHTNDFVSMKLTYDDFLWAWSVVNTRSVYCENKNKSTCSIHVVDSLCLALAPLLDMFNHSNESDLKAELCDDGHYKIIATGTIPRYSQIFIHYGHHSNFHLYLEYGFVMSNNMYDVISFSVDEILKITKELFPNLYSYSNAKKLFISLHNMYKELICTSHGISFNVKGLIYVLTSPEIEKPNFQKKIYSNSYNKHESNIIDVVGQKLIEMKIVEFTGILIEMNKKSEETSRSFNIAKCLVKEFLNMLKKAQSSIDREEQ